MLGLKLNHVSKRGHCCNIVICTHVLNIDRTPVCFVCFVFIIWARFLSVTRSKLGLCSANHRAGYFSNLACDWLSIVWAYSEQETENGPWSSVSVITVYWAILSLVNAHQTELSRRISDTGSLSFMICKSLAFSIITSVKGNMLAKPE